jgi:hypothetical protein
MKINLAFWDRLLRFIFGFLFLTWALAGGPWWAYFGLYLIITASWGLCPLYAFLKIKTAQFDDQNRAPPE